MNDDIEKMNKAFHDKRNTEKISNFTKHIENVSNLIRSYNYIQIKQDKLQAEIFDIKKRLEKIFNNLTIN